MRAETDPQPPNDGRDPADPERHRRLHKQRHGAPSPLAVDDDSLHELLARAGQGGTY